MDSWMKRELKEYRLTIDDENKKDYSEIKRLYKNYLNALDQNDFEERIVAGKKLLLKYKNTNKEVMETLSHYESEAVDNPLFYMKDLSKIMEEIEWRIANDTILFSSTNNMDTELSETQQIKVVPDKTIQLDRLEIGRIPKYSFHSVGKKFNKNGNTCSFIALALETTHIVPELGYVIGICLIQIDDYIPTHVLDSTSNKYSIDELVPEIKELIRNKPLVMFDGDDDLRQLYVNGLDLTDNNMYSLVDIVKRNTDEIPVEKYDMESIASYYGYNFNHNSLKERCYIVGRLFEKVIDSITDNRFRRY